MNCFAGDHHYPQRDVLRCYQRGLQHESRQCRIPNGSRMIRTHSKIWDSPNRPHICSLQRTGYDNVLCSRNASTAGQWFGWVVGRLVPSSRLFLSLSGWEGSTT